MNLHKMSLNPSKFFDGEYLELAKAISNEDMAKVQKMASMIPLNFIAEENMTLLLWAIIEKSPKALTALLIAGADPNLSIDNKGSVVNFTCALEDTTYIKLLLKYGGDPNVQMENGQPLTVFAALHSNWENVSVLLEHGAEINAKDKNGDTVAMLYASLNDFEEVYRLIKLGAEITVQNKNNASLFDRINQASPIKNTSSYEWLQKTKELLRTMGFAI